MFWAYCFIVTLSVVILSLAGTWLMQYLLTLYQLNDIPNERSNHSIPTPRGAGVAFMIPALGFMMVTGAPHLMLWAALGVMVISFFDDLESVPLKQRLIVQVAAVFLTLPSMDGMVFHGFLPWWLDEILTAFILLAFMNLYNFMDGIDGITGSQTVAFGAGFLGLGMVLEHPSLYGLPADGLILMAATGSFLLFNWHPAKVFMGDSGSVPLGLVVGFLLLQTAAAGYPVAAAILPAYYLVDGGLTFLGRLMRKEKVWEAHSQHAYQHAVRMGWPHDKVVIAISRFNALAVVLAIAAPFCHDYWFAPLLVAYAGAVALRQYFLRLSKQGEIIPPNTAAAS